MILDDELADSEAAEILSASSGAEISVTKAEIVTELTARFRFQFYKFFAFLFDNFFFVFFFRCASLDSALAHASEISLVTRFVNQVRERKKKGRAGTKAAFAFFLHSLIGTSFD